MRSYILILTFLFNSAVLSQWTKLDFVYGGSVVSGVKDSSGTIFISTYNGILYKSTNNGNNWERFNNDFPSTTVSVFLATENYIFAGSSGNGVYRTSDNGVTWILHNNGITTGTIYSLLRYENLMFAGTQDGVYRSSNWGYTWESVNANIGFTHGIQAMVLLDSMIFASSGIGASGTIYRSTNNGNNWFVFNSGLPSFVKDRLASVSGNVYAAGGSGFYETTNKGISWHYLPGFPANSFITALSQRGNIVFATYGLPSSSASITTNGGSNWTHFTNDFTEGFFKNVLFTSDSMLGFSATGVHKSTNLGVNWISSNSGIDQVNIYNIVANNNNVVLNSYSGVYRSSNFGNNWISVLLGVSSTIYKPIKWINNDLLIDQQNKIVKSTDYGSSFSDYVINLPNSYNFTFLAGNNAFYGSSNSGIFKSTNLGTNWFPSNDGIIFNSVLNAKFMTSINNILYAFVIPGSLPNDTARLYYSTNEGINWNSMGNNGLTRYVRSLAYNPFNNKFYAITTINGILVSSNGGFNWSAENSGLQSNLNITSIFFNGDSIFVTTRTNGVYKCFNQTHQWVPDNENITNLKLNTISGSNNYLYTAGDMFGPFRRNLDFLNSANSQYQIIKTFKLEQNYPNPFNPATAFKLSLPVKSNIKLAIFDITGKEIAVIAEGNYKPGDYNFTWNAENYASGVYFYKLFSKEFASTGKMILIK